MVIFFHKFWVWNQTYWKLIYVAPVSVNWWPPYPHAHHPTPQPPKKGAIVRKTKKVVYCFFCNCLTCNIWEKNNWNLFCFDRIADKEMWCLFRRHLEWLVFQKCRLTFYSSNCNVAKASMLRYKYSYNFWPPLPLCGILQK